MASLDRLCRLCRTTVKANRCQHLFGRSSSKHHWPFRITALLDIPVSDIDGYSQYVCQMCTRRIQSLENALADLKAFKDLAQSTLSHAQDRGPSKRTRVTCADVGVSPDTAKARPSSKLARKKLSFQSPPKSGLQDTSGRLAETAEGVHSVSTLTSARLSHSQLSRRAETPTEVSEQATVTLETSFTLTSAESSADIDQESRQIREMESVETLEAEHPFPCLTSTRNDSSPPIASLQALEISPASQRTTASRPPARNAQRSIIVTVTSSSQNSTWTKTLSQEEGEIAHNLAVGNTTGFVSALMDIGKYKEGVFTHILQTINNECSTLCQTSCPSLFRSIPVASLSKVNWVEFITELGSKAPTLLQMLVFLVSVNDARNTIKVGAVHFPGICAAVLLKERNREMCGIQSLASVLMYSCHCEKQVYNRLNHLNLCVSYNRTLEIMGKLSLHHTIPLEKWIREGVIFKFWGDNVDKLKKVRDPRADHTGDMIHMFSILAGRSRTPAPHLPHVGVSLAELDSISAESFLPTASDVRAVKDDLVAIISRVLTKYIAGLAPLAKVVPKHILHQYSKEMSGKSEVCTLDVLMKNEAKHSDMVDILRTLQGYLGSDYDEERRVVSGGDQLTCERQVGAQMLTSCADSVKERVQLLEPVCEDWHCLVALLRVAWKKLYSKSSSDYGTLAFFRSRLNRVAVSNEPKKCVDACIELIEAVVKGHWLACACEILGLSSINDSFTLPPHIRKGTASEKLRYVREIAKQVVERFTLVDTAFLENGLKEDGSQDHMYNYTRVLCHYGSLTIEFRDAWGEGDGKRVERCWILCLPHFKESGRTKYAWEALRLLFQLKTLSPNLSHQIQWNRFVNTRGGMGNNIPCDLHNEHVNKDVKSIITNMQANFAGDPLQRAVRCVTPLNEICQNFDEVTSVPLNSSTHSTKSDTGDIALVVSLVLRQNLLKKIPPRHHQSLQNIRLNPLCNWDRAKTKSWILEKKTLFRRHKGRFRQEDIGVNSDDD